MIKGEKTYVGSRGCIAKTFFAAWASEPATYVVAKATTHNDFAVLTQTLQLMSLKISWD
jgi:hypothetical protein